MKAAIVREINKIEVEDLPIPEIGPEEALIKVEYIGICGTDIHVYSGNHATAKYPVIPGHEFSGTLVKMNSQYKHDVKIGDRVLAHPLTSCGVCDFCVSGRENICKELKIFGIHQHGCFAEYIKVPAKKVYKIPDSVDSRLAAIVEPLAVAVHDVKTSSLTIGKSVLVIGGGPIGVLIAMVARLNGATQIVISEVNKNRNEFIKKLGFTVVNPMETDIEQAIKDLTNGSGFDFVYEASGAAVGAELMTKAARLGGTVMLVGIPRKPYTVDTNACIVKELIVKGVRIHPQINFKAAVDILESGVMNSELEKLFTHEFSLDDAKEAIRFSIEDTDHFKVLMKV